METGRAGRCCDRAVASRAHDTKCASPSSASIRWQWLAAPVSVGQLPNLMLPSHTAGTLLAPSVEASPAKERHIKAHHQGGDGRKFSWATQKIHELTTEMESYQGKMKVGWGWT